MGLVLLGCQGSPSGTSTAADVSSAEPATTATTTTATTTAAPATSSPAADVPTTEETDATESATADPSAVVRAPKRANVGVSQLKRRDFTVFVNHVGVLKPWREVRVEAPIGGLLEAWEPQDGQRVREGELLAQIDQRERVINHDIAAARLELEAVQLKRLERLFGRRLVSASALDQQRNRFEQTEVDVERTRFELEKATVRAPLSGVSAKAGVERGEFLQKGQLLTMLLVMDPLRVEMLVPSKQLVDLRHGQPVQVRIDAFEGRRFRGKIDKLGLQAGLRDRAFRVETHIENPDGILRGGMFARLRVATKRYRRQIVIPRRTVLERPGRRVVFVLEMTEEGEYARERQIQLGRSVNEEDVQVVDGLQAGEWLIVEGQHKLVADEQVRVLQRDGAVAAEASADKS